MFRHLDRRAGHYLLLFTVAAGLFLPNLGAASLWDIDEGNNAEAAREMLEADKWITPSFNYQLRVDKPALLYWLQAAIYQVCGVNELAARLPSALAALAAVLTAYELGRRLFDARAGLLSGLVLAGTLGFGVAAHFANPDALLTLFSLLALFSFWAGYSRGGRGWFVPFGAATGLAVLAKGPVGLALPALAVGLFLLWEGRLRLLADRRLALGLVAFALVAAPWYALVGAETKGEFLRRFLLTHNLGRFRAPMESHGGPVFYYLLVLPAGFAPWSAFLAPVGWFAVREFRAGVHRPALKFLTCWIAVYFVFFSFSGTKLPNYVLPLYPALAVLTARFLERWRRGLVRPPAWVVHVSLTCLVLVGVVTAGGFLVAGGALPIPTLRDRVLPGLAKWAALGAVPALGAAAAWWCVRRQQRGAAVGVVAAAAVLFLGGLGAGVGKALNRCKAPRPLVQALEAARTEDEVRVAAYHYFQPSLVFYCRREVDCLDQEETAVEFLRCPLQVYLFVPAPVWEEMQARVPVPCRLLGRRRDLYRGCDVVLVTNR